MGAFWAILSFLYVLKAKRKAIAFVNGNVIANVRRRRAW